MATASRQILDEIVSLADAATDLGLAQSTLRYQAVAGRIGARVIGKTWITTRDEVDRSRREQLGQPDRPAGHVKCSVIKATRRRRPVTPAAGRGDG